MTEILTKVDVDCSTGETVIVPLTAEELAQRELDIATAEQAEAARLAAEVEAAAKRTAVLEALATAAGLSVQEVTEALG